MRFPARFLLTFAVVVTGAPAALAADVGVSINVPGIFGRIDLGGIPQPQLIYNQPVVIDRGPGYAEQPVYLHVPPGRERNWRRYCHTYDACNRPVYFVRDDWYRNVYTPRYREMHAHDDRRGPGPRGDSHGDDHRGDQDRGHDDHDRGGDRGHEDHEDHDDHGDHGDHGDGRGRN